MPFYCIYKMHSKVICRFFDDEQMKPDKIRWVRIENRIMMASKKIFMDHHNLTFSFVGEKFFLLFLVEGIINGGVGKLMMALIQCVRCDLYYHETHLLNTNKALSEQGFIEILSNKTCFAFIRALLFHIDWIFGSRYVWRRQKTKPER